MKEALGVLFRITLVKKGEGSRNLCSLLPKLQ